MKEVIIEIKGTQQYSEDNTDVTTFTTRGFLKFEKNGYSLFYDESEIIGAKGVSTTLTLENENKMTLLRSGGMQSRLVVEKGRRHSCFYNTPEGDFVIGIYGDSLTSEMSESGGKIHMSYTIDVNSEFVSKNIMDIKIKEYHN